MWTLQAFTHTHTSHQYFYSNGSRDWHCRIQDNKSKVSWSNWSRRIHQQWALRFWFFSSTDIASQYDTVLNHTTVAQISNILYTTKGLSRWIYTTLRISFLLLGYWETIMKWQLTPVAMFLCKFEDSCASKLSSFCEMKNPCIHCCAHSLTRLSPYHYYTMNWFCLFWDGFCISNIHALFLCSALLIFDVGIFMCGIVCFWIHWLQRIHNIY